MILNVILSGSIVVIAILLTIFLNYPEPPTSPLLYQWQTENGKQFEFKSHHIFYKDARANGSNDLVLLCLHGFPTSSFDWYKVWPDLKRNFNRIIAPDFLGFGFSDKPLFHVYSITEQADLVEDLLGYLNLKRVHILAHDYGDTVTQELLARQIEGILTFSIETVCMLNGGIFPSKHQPRLVQKLLTYPVLGTFLVKMSNYYMFKWSLCEIFGQNTQPEIYEVHDMWKLIRHKNGYQILGGLLSYMEERRQNEDRWVSAIRSGKTPLHFIYGPSDPINPPPFERFYKEIIFNASIDSLNGIGHYVQIEAPKQMIHSYFNWMKKNGFLEQIIYNN